MKLTKAWRSQRVLIEDGRPYFSAATYLPVRSWRFVLPFLLLSGRIERQAKQTPGLVAYGLRAEPRRGRFWTMSCWTSRETAGAFVKEEPHATAVRRFANWAGDGAAFVEWESRQTEIDWDEAFRRLEHPTTTFNRRRRGEAPETGANPG